MSSTRSLPRIICFGDSLTAGFQSPTSERPVAEDTPYGMFLQDRMRNRAEVRISGVCGELTSEMTCRLGRDVLAHHPAATVILGGTNDLGWDRTPQDIMRNLLEMYHQARAAGIQVVGVTVPSIRGFDEHIPRRLELNVMIRDQCAALGMSCADLFTATAEPATLRLAERYSSDGLHLTTAGYELLATMLYEQVFQRVALFGEGG